MLCVPLLQNIHGAEDPKLDSTKHAAHRRANTNIRRHQCKHRKHATESKCIPGGFNGSFLESIQNLGGFLADSWRIQVDSIGLPRNPSKILADSWRILGGFLADSGGFNRAPRNPSKIMADSWRIPGGFRWIRCSGFSWRWRFVFLDRFYIF